MAGATAFKDEISPATIRRLGAAVAATAPGADAAAFGRRARRGLAELELKARVAHVAEALHRTLVASDLGGPRGLDVPAALDAVATAVEQADLGMWEAWPAVTWVELHGRDHPTEALEALGRMTGHASAEFAVRPYLVEHPELALAALARFAADPDPHRRRLASEGTRPRLPWGTRLQAFVDDPTPVIGLLDALVGDPSEDVRRSVANNVNDIAKDHPDLAVATVRRWLDEHPGAATDRLAHHALRSLRKVGHPGAIAALGFDPDVDVAVASVAVEPATVHLGDQLTITVVLRGGATAARVHLDWVLDRPLADGSRGTKVFALGERALGAGEALVVRRRHRLAAVTVRTYQPGEHRIDVHVNGRRHRGTTFELLDGG